MEIYSSFLKVHFLVSQIAKQFFGVANCQAIFWCRKLPSNFLVSQIAKQFFSVANCHGSNHKPPAAHVFFDTPFLAGGVARW
jgi:hypothetical protein